MAESFDLSPGEVLSVKEDFVTFTANPSAPVIFDARITVKRDGRCFVPSVELQYATVTLPRCSRKDDAITVALIFAAQRGFEVRS